jgi:predicted RNA-binding Zn-ribbon protein involved in translation (DUF1610 family)
MAKKTNKSTRKRITCTFCGGMIEVSAKAMSIFCPHCHKRVVCEDYTIRSYHAVRNLATCGKIIVERKGHVVAPIRADALIIRGLVRGNIQARSVVEIESTGTVQGNVEAPRLVMHEGGKLIGSCKILRNGRPPKRLPPKDESSPTATRRRQMPGRSAASPTAATRVPT